MNLSTDNLEKTIRALKSGYVRKTVDCLGCDKRINFLKHNYIGMVNGFGGFNYYHSDCLLKKYGNK